MHTTAKISNVGSGYAVVLGPRFHQTNRFTSFEDAYKNACNWVGWNLEYLKFDILPQEVRDIKNKVDAERRMEVLEGQIGSTYSTYLEAKKNFEKAKVGNNAEI